jgi:hypothetical protein
VRYLEKVGDALHNTVQALVVDQRIAALVVAQGLIKTILDGIEYDDFVGLAS